MMDNGGSAMLVAEYIRTNKKKLLRPKDIWNVVTQRNLEITGKSDNSIIDQENGKYFHFVYDPTPEKNILMIYYQNPEMKELY